MIRREIGRFVMATLVMTAPMPAVAQPQPNAQRPSPAAAPPNNVVTLACCRCIGTAQRISINSGSGPGSVPYRVTGPGVPPGAFGQTIAANTIHPLWTASTAPAQWIHPNNTNGMANQPAGTYRYEVRIVVPRGCVIPMRVRLGGRAAGDDAVTIKLTNLQTTATTTIGATPLVAIASPPPVVAGAGGWGFRAERIAPFGANLGPGSYVLAFEVSNGGGPQGLLVNATLSVECLGDPPVDPASDQS